MYDDNITSASLPIPAEYDTWLDFFYDQDSCYVSIFYDKRSHVHSIICSDKYTYKLYDVPANEPKWFNRTYFLDSNNTAIVINPDTPDAWVRINMLSADDTLLLAKTMLPTSIWMLMCILGFDYDTLTEEVLSHEVEY